VVVSIILENAGGGSSNAAPLVRKIMDYYFRQTSEPLMGEPTDFMPAGVSTNENE
jgi:penicillin-binding protein 2